MSFLKFSIKAAEVKTEKEKLPFKFCYNSAGGKGGFCEHKGTEENTRHLCKHVDCPGWD